MDIDWTGLVPEQLDWHWQQNLRPRFAGLTDEEYFWEPVANCWSVRPRGLGADGMAQPCGPAEGPFAEYPMAALVLHINREALHHGAEIALLRDLYLNR